MPTSVLVVPWVVLGIAGLTSALGIAGLVTSAIGERRWRGGLVRGPVSVRDLRLGDVGDGGRPETLASRPPEGTLSRTGALNDVDGRDRLTTADRAQKGRGLCGPFVGAREQTVRTTTACAD
jgi:hypothetical protein